MARPNPNPTRISGPMWNHVLRCTDATGTAFNAEYGGTWLRKPGSHADTEWLFSTRPNDYSLQGALQRIVTGPLSKFTRAFDHTFPSAQRGDWSEIGEWSLNVRRAWETNDPRMYGVFEVLCQTPEDREPEGYVFYPSKKFRVPDSTHEWHRHEGFLTAYINDQHMFDSYWSALRGRPLDEWLRGEGALPGRENDMGNYMLQVRGNDSVYISDGFQYRGITFPYFVFARDTLKLSYRLVENNTQLAEFGGELWVEDDEVIATLSAEQLARIEAAASEGAQQGTGIDPVLLRNIMDEELDEAFSRGADHDG